MVVCKTFILATFPLKFPTLKNRLTGLASFSACAEPLENVSYWYVSEEFVITDYPYYYYHGWHNYMVDGQQYVIPSLDDLQYLDWENSEFHDEIYYYYFVAIDGMSTAILHFSSP